MAEATARKIDEIRQKYPAYKDVPDDKLAAALHKKFYAARSQAEVFERLGVPYPEQLVAPEPPPRQAMPDRLSASEPPPMAPRPAAPAPGIAPAVAPLSPGTPFPRGFDAFSENLSVIPQSQMGVGRPAARPERGAPEAPAAPVQIGPAVALGEEDIAPVEDVAGANQLTREYGSLFVRGVAEIPAGMVRDVSIAGAQRATEQRTILDRIDRGEQVDLGGDPVFGSAGRLRADLMRYQAMSPEDRARVRPMLEDELGAVDPRQRPAYQAGESLSQAVEQTLPVSDQTAQSMPGQVASGLGSAVGFIGTGIVGRTIGLPPVLSVSIPGSAVSSAGQFQEALQSGASFEDAFAASNIMRAVGVSEALPIANLFERFDKGTGGRLRATLINTAAQGGEEAVQEAFQTIMGNLTESTFVGYNPETGIFDGVGDAATVGGIVGAILGALTGFGGRHAPPAPQSEIDRRLDALGARATGMADRGEAFNAQMADKAQETPPAVVPPPVPAPTGDAGLSPQPAAAPPVEEEADPSLQDTLQTIEGTLRGPPEPAPREELDAVLEAVDAGAKPEEAVDAAAARREQMRVEAEQQAQAAAAGEAQAAADAEAAQQAEAAAQVAADAQARVEAEEASDSTGLASMGSGMAQAMGENLRERLWQEYAGQAQAIDPLAIRARREAPGMSREEFIAWAEAVDAGREPPVRAQPPGTTPQPKAQDEAPAAPAQAEPAPERPTGDAFDAMTAEDWRRRIPELEAGVARAEAALASEKESGGSGVNVNLAKREVAQAKRYVAKARKRLAELEAETPATPPAPPQDARKPEPAPAAKQEPEAAPAAAAGGEVVSEADTIELESGARVPAIRDGGETFIRSGEQFVQVFPEADGAYYRVGQDYGSSIDDVRAKVGRRTAVDTPDRARENGIRSRPYEALAALPDATLADIAKRLKIKTKGVDRNTLIERIVERPISGRTAAIVAATQGAFPASSARPIRADTAVTSRGREIPVEYAVIEAGDLVASQTNDFADNPAYPQWLQPRDRSRAASRQQVTEMAANLNPRLLGETPNAGQGAPIVGGDGFVESGNGRVLAIKRAYQGGKADAYRQHLESQGYPVEGMTAPVLVRVNKAEMSQQERAAFAREANERDTLSMGAGERAMADAEAISDATLELYRGGAVDLAANRPFVRALLEEAVGANERAGMIRSDGSMAQDAIRRIEAALLAKAYGDPDLVASLVEDSDSDIKAIGGALTDVAAAWSKMRSEAGSEAIDPAMDQTAALLEAVKLVQNARRQGRNVAEFVGQTDMFSGSAISPMARAFLGLMFRNRKQWTQPTDRGALGAYLRFYADEAMKATPGIDLLGLPPVKADDILGLLEGKNNGQPDDQGNLLAQPARRPGEGERGSSGDRDQAAVPPAGEGGGATAAAAGAEAAGPAGSDAAPGEDFDSIFDDALNEQFGQETDGAPTASEGLEPDSGGAGAPDGVGGADVPPRRGRARGGARKGARAAGGGQGAAAGDQRVPGDGAAPVGEGRDPGVRSPEPAPAGEPAGDPDAGGGRKGGRNRPAARRGRKSRAGDAAPTVTESATSAAKNVVMGLDDVTRGLSELFGGGKTIGSGLAFDEDTYRKAVPFFRAGVAHFAEAGADIADMVRALVKHLAGAGMDRAAVERMRPYVQRFVEDVRSGEVEPAADATRQQAVDEARDREADRETKLEAQRAAEKVEVRVGDLDNVRATLPFLQDAQQEDVHKAESRLSQPGKHGFMFTNGTGTGKTYVGLGVIKRYARQGRGNVLIVAPSQPILQDWKTAAEDLGLKVSVLDSTTDAGKGIVATTYANLGENRHLVDRKWDLVVADESHKLSSAQDGNETDALRTLRAITNHPRGRYVRADHILRDQVDEIASLNKQIKALNKSDDERDWRQAGPLQAKLDRALAAYKDRRDALLEQFRGEPRANVTFLSATPFAYDLNVDYGEGYLFDYGERERTGYNQPDGRDAFFMQHFGYRMRTGKLTQPDASVNSDVLERAFHEHLKREGSLSGRSLEVEADYERKFVLVEDAIGQKIDEALTFLGEADKRKFRPLLDLVNEKFDYLARMRLLEAIKARRAIPRIRKHLGLGRKVVVFHDYNEGGGINPFVLAPPDKKPGDKVDLKALYDEFLQRNPYVLTLKFADNRSPIDEITRAFPDAMVYNGTVTPKRRNEIKRQFNEDGSGKDIIIVQSAAGEAGISLHDTTGKHQRVLMNLGMPVRPVTALQEEGRIYRVGQVTNAVFEYLNTGTNWERWTFAQRIAHRSSTAENLALGDQARAIRQSFIDAFQESSSADPTADDGTGGKERDRATNATISDFERAKTYYYAQGKRSGRRDQREGIDYFATPEPIALKMVEFADIKFGEKVLEPSAGHGAIARFFPEGSIRTVVEPSAELASRAALAAPGARMVTGRFEDLDVGANKFDAIVMNPPFGLGGKTAVDHLAKAVKHLRNGGRIVAIIPTGPAADKRFDAFMDDEELSKNVYLVADMAMPGVMFERAGTSVRTRIVVLEKQTDADVSPPQQASRDYSNAETVAELFDRIEDAGLAGRSKPSTTEIDVPEDGSVNAGGIEFKLRTNEKSKQPFWAEPGKIGRGRFFDVARASERAGGIYDRYDRAFQFKTAEARLQFLQALENPDTQAETAAAEPGGEQFDLAETTHSKTGKDLFVATIRDRVERERYTEINAVAKKHGGYYSAFRGKGAVPGFQFPSAEQRAAFVAEITGADTPRFSLRLTDKAKAKLPALERDLRARLEKLGIADKVALRVVEAIRQNVRGQVVEADAMWLRGAITVALDAADAAGALNHEVIHALRELGMFTRSEWRALERAARADGDLFAKVRRKYDGLGLTEAQILEEVIAEHYRMWADGRAQNGGLMRRAFEKLRDFFRALGQALRGQGLTTAEGVFERVESGRVGRRGDRDVAQPSDLWAAVGAGLTVAGVAAKAGMFNGMFSKRVATDTPEFPSQRAKEAWQMGERHRREFADGDVDPSQLSEDDLGFVATIEASQPVARAFYESARRGAKKPALKRGTRKGAAPKGGTSRNWVDNRGEIGVSMANVEGVDYQWFPTGERMSSDVVEYEGWLLDPDEFWGSDGEPLMVGIKPVPDPPISFSLRQPPSGTTALDHAKATAGKHVGKPTPLKESIAQWWEKTTENGMNRSIQATIDRFHSLRVLEQRMLGDNQSRFDASHHMAAFTSAHFAMNESAYMHAAMYYGPPVLNRAEGVVDFDDGTKSLLTLLEPLDTQDRIDAFEHYAWARRANELKRSGREPAPQSDIDDGLALAREYPELRQVFDDWTAFNRKVVAFARDSGLITDEAARSYLADAHYVPFYRAEVDSQGRRLADRSMSSGSGITNMRSGIKRLKGSDKAVAGIIDNMVRNTERLIARSYRNIAAQKATALMIGASQQFGEEIIKKPPPKWALELVPMKMLEEAVSGAGLNVDFSNLSAAEKREIVGIWGMVPPAFRAPDGSMMFSVMIAGKPQWFVTTDPMLFESLSSLTPRQMGMIANTLFQIARAPARMLRWGVTNEPTFAIANFLRDTASTFVVYGAGPGHLARVMARFFKRSASGIVYGERFNDRSVAEIQAAGGGIGGWWSEGPSSVRKALQAQRRDVSLARKAGRAAMGFWKRYQEVLRASEQANRIVLYDRLRAKGTSKAEAAFQAMDVTNFSARGSSEAVRILVELTPFLNARIQGLNRLYRGAAHKLSGNAGPYRSTRTGFVVNGLILMAATMALYAVNYDDEDYADLEGWERDLYYHIRLPKFLEEATGARWFRIPRPFEVGVIFSTLPERAMDQVFRLAGSEAKRDEDLTALRESLFRAATDTFAVQPTQIGKIAMEQWSNWSTFLGRSIVPTYEQEGLPPYMQYGPGTSEAAKWIGRQTGASPRRIEHLIRELGGSMAAHALVAADSAISQAQGRTDPARRWYEMPVISRFVRGDSVYTRWAERYYTLQQETDALVATINKLEREGADPAEIDALDTDEHRDRRQFFRGTRKDLRGIRDDMSDIYADPGMTPEAKRQALDELRRERTSIYREVRDLTVP